MENELVPKVPRRKRDFTPEEKKDSLYWDKRRRNNEAAKRSRDKKRRRDSELQDYITALREDNFLLSTELMTLKMHFGLVHPAESNHLQHPVQSTAQPATPTSRYLQSPQTGFCWRDRDYSGMSNHQTSDLVVPSCSLRPMRGYSYVDTSATPGYGIVTPLVLPQRFVPPIYPVPGPPY